MKLVPTLFLAVALAVSVSGAGAQTPTPAPAPSPIHLPINAGMLSGLPRRTINATDEGGHTNSYSGVSLRDLLVRAGAPSGMRLRGKAMTSYIVVEALDNYRVLFALPELDESYTDHFVLIADSRDGAPLPANAGPYRLIVPYDKRDARWVRQVTEVDLDDVPTP